MVADCLKAPMYKDRVQGLEFNFVFPLKSTAMRQQRRAEKRGLVQKLCTSNHAATQLSMCYHGNHLPQTHWAALCSVISAEQRDECVTCIFNSDWVVYEVEGSEQRE